MIEKAITHVDAANESLATQRIVERLKEAGVIVIPTVGAARHAEKVAELGVDAVIAQGSEGGGHTGVIPTSLLIPQVIDSVEIPVIAWSTSSAFLVAARGCFPNPYVGAEVTSERLVAAGE